MSRLLSRLGRAGIPEERIEALRKAGCTTLDALQGLPEARLKQLAGSSAPLLQALGNRWTRKRAVRSRPKRKFVRYHSGSRRKLSTAWRRARGMHNKVRQERIGKPARVKAGYGWTAHLRHIHPSGFLEVLVHRPEEIAGLKLDQAVRIGGRVGRRKRLEIQGKAREMGLRVLNPLREAPKSDEK